MIQALFDLHWLAAHSTSNVSSPDLIRRSGPTHGVVLGHGPHFYLAQYRIQCEATVQPAMRISGLLRLPRESPVPQRQIHCLEVTIGLRTGAGFYFAQAFHQPVLCGAEETLHP